MNIVRKPVPIPGLPFHGLEKGRVYVLAESYGAGDVHMAIQNADTRTMMMLNLSTGNTWHPAEHRRFIHLPEATITA